ncbi:hypothetical protein PTKIN_Ptkin15bG0156500 [Pterospermum kingtungense]
MRNVSDEYHFRSQGFKQNPKSKCPADSSGLNNSFEFVGNKTYADVVRGDCNVKVNHLVPNAAEFVRLSIGKNKSSLSLNSVGKSLSYEHVQVSLVNGFLDIRINLIEVLNLLNSNVSKGPNSSSKSVLSSEISNIDQAIVDKSDEVGIGANGSYDQLITSHLDKGNHPSKSVDASNISSSSDGHGNYVGADLSPQSEIVVSKDNEQVSKSGNMVEGTKGSAIGDDRLMQALSAVDAEVVMDVGGENLCEGKDGFNDCEHKVEVFEDDESEIKEDSIDDFGIDIFKIQRKKKKQRNHRIRFEDCFAGGVSDYSLSDEDIRPRNEVILKELDDEAWIS